VSPESAADTKYVSAATVAIEINVAHFCARRRFIAFLHGNIFTQTIASGAKIFSNYLSSEIHFPPARNIQGIFESTT
jgi:hypothetical protein